MTGAELRQLRTEAHLSASALARLLAVHERSIYKWEHGERKINRFVAAEIRRVLHGRVRKGTLRAETSDTPGTPP